MPSNPEVLAAPLLQVEADVEAASGPTTAVRPNIDQLIEEARDTGILELWRNESKGIERSSTVNLVVEMFKNLQTTIESQPEMVLYALYSLEQRFKDAPAEAQSILHMFSYQIEEVFKPCPSEATMTEFARDMVELVNTKQGSLEAAFQDWGKAKRYHHVGKYEALRRTMPSEEDSMVDALQATLQKYHGKYKEYIVLRWFLNGLLRSADEGKFTFLGVEELANMELRCSEKQVLAWTTVGWVSYTLIQYRTMDPNHFVYGKTSAVFQEVMTRTVPGFVFKLTEFKGVLAAQAEKVKSLKRKMMAGIISGVVSGVPLLFRVVMRKS